MKLDYHIQQQVTDHVFMYSTKLSKEYCAKLKERQTGSVSQVHFIWVGLSYHQIITAFQTAMKQFGLKSAMITFIAAQKRGCITIKEHTRIYESLRKNEIHDIDDVRKHFKHLSDVRKHLNGQATSFLDDLEAFIERIKDRFTMG